MDASQFKTIVGSKFFTVEFQKKDGSIRKLNGRVGVTKHLKGTGNPITDGRVVVWETGHKEAGNSSYRSFYPDTVISVKVGKKVFNKDGQEVA